MKTNHKHKLNQNIHPFSQFDKFLKLRNQKQSIINSQTQDISQKVQGFQQLLKLTKTGNTINNHSINNAYNHHNLIIGNKKNNSSNSRSFHQTTENITNNNSIYGQNNANGNNKIPFNFDQTNQINNGFMQFDMFNHSKFDQVESDQAQLKKLNKMVSGLTEWEDQKQITHQEKKVNTSHKTSKLAKRQYKQNNNNTNPSNNIKDATNTLAERAKIVYSSDYGTESKKFKKFNAILNKNSFVPQQKLLRTSANLNYPPALLKNNLFSHEDNFKELRQKIKVLENKAIKQYGLKFQPKINTQSSTDKFKSIEQKIIENENKKDKINKQVNRILSVGQNQDSQFGEDKQNLNKFSQEQEFYPIQLNQQQPSLFCKGNNQISDDFRPKDRVHIFNDYSVPKGLINLVKVGNNSFDYSNSQAKSVNLDRLLRKKSSKRYLFANTIKNKSFRSVNKSFYKYVRV